MRNQRATLAGIVTLSLFLSQGVAGGQDLPDLKIATASKVGVVLSALHEDYISHQRQGDGTEFESERPSVRIAEDRVVIDAVASGNASVLLADLEALGMEKASSFGRMVSGQLPIRAIADANALDSLQFARPAGAATRDPVGPATPRPRASVD